MADKFWRVEVSMTEYVQDEEGNYSPDEVQEFVWADTHEKATAQVIYDALDRLPTDVLLQADEDSEVQGG